MMGNKEIVAEVGNKMKFRKEESNFCKGVAIILMLFHHLFYKVDNYSGFIINFSPFSEERINFYALLGKICVAIFVFISGYGIAASYRQVFQYKKAEVKEIVSFTWKRLWKLETFYWFAFLLTLACQPLGRTIFDAYGTDLKSIIVYFFIDFFGLSYLFGTPTLNPTWWYMTLAILIVVLMPFVMKLIEKMGTSLVLFAGIGILFFLNASNANTFYLFSLYLGVGCFESRLFERIGELWNDKKWGIWIKGFIAIVAFLILLSLRTNYNYFGIVDGLIAMNLAVLSSLLFVHIPIFSSVMQCLGKHSGNIFLVHNQIYSYYFQSFIYSFGHWIVILFTLLAVSFLVSVVMEILKKVLRYDKLMGILGMKIVTKLEWKSCGEIAE